MISIRRISRFLSLDEKDDPKRDILSSSNRISSVGESLKASIKNDRNQNGTHLKDAKEFDLAISKMTACFPVIEGVDKASFLDDAGKKTRAESEKTVKLFNVLKNINFACRPGELVIVVGPVGVCSNNFKFSKTKINLLVGWKWQNLASADHPIGNTDS